MPRMHGRPAITSGSAVIRSRVSTDEVYPRGQHAHRLMRREATCISVRESYGNRPQPREHRCGHRPLAPAATLVNVGASASGVLNVKLRTGFDAVAINPMRYTACLRMAKVNPTPQDRATPQRRLQQTPTETETSRVARHCTTGQPATQQVRRRSVAAVARRSAQRASSKLQKPPTAQGLPRQGWCRD